MHGGQKVQAGFHTKDNVVKSSNASNISNQLIPDYLWLLRAAELCCMCTGEDDALVAKSFFCI